MRFKFSNVPLPLENTVMSENTLRMIKEHNIKWVDLRSTDFGGNEQHITVTASSVDVDVFVDVCMYDGSSCTGWNRIDVADMIMRPDDSTCFIGPSMEDVTLILRCHIIA